MQKNKKDMRLNLNNFEAYVILKTEKEVVPGGTGRRQLYGEKDYHYQS